MLCSWTATCNTTTAELQYDHTAGTATRLLSTTWKRSHSAFLGQEYLHWDHSWRTETTDHSGLDPKPSQQQFSCLAQPRALLRRKGSHSSQACRKAPAEAGKRHRPSATATRARRLGHLVLLLQPSPYPQHRGLNRAPGLMQKETNPGEVAFKFLLS